MEEPQKTAQAPHEQPEPLTVHDLLLADLPARAQRPVVLCVLSTVVLFTLALALSPHRAELGYIGGGIMFGFMSARGALRCL